MLNIPENFIDHLVMPLGAAQLFTVVFIYMIIVRRRIAAEFKLYLRFLACFIFFLVARPVQEFSTVFVYGVTLYTRMSLLFVVCAPALITASFLQAGFRINRLVSCLLYLTAGITSVAYCALLGSYHGEPILFFGITSEMLSWIPPAFTGHHVQLLGSALFYVLPFCFLLFHQLWIRRFKSGQIAFLTGTLFFGVTMTIAIYLRDFSLIYPGSFISGCIWIWAVFHDVRDMKGKVMLLKEELQMLVQSGNSAVSDNLVKLLKELEIASHGNLDVYKMQVREILLMLADTGIAAGADPQKLLDRSDDLEQKVKESSDVLDIQRIVNEEASEVTALIAEAPNAAVEQARAYMNEHYGQDLSVQMIADTLNLSKHYFMRLFKKETEQTVNQYLKELRMEKAKVLLKTRSITDTAHAVGFNDSNYFGTVFKKHTGMTPSQYQQDYS